MQNHKSIQFVYKVQFNRFHSKDAPSNYVKHVEGNSYKCLCISVALPNSCPAKMGQERGRGTRQSGWLIENFYQLLRILWAFYLYAAWLAGSLTASCMLPCCPVFLCLLPVPTRSPRAPACSLFSPSDINVAFTCDFPSASSFLHIPLPHPYLHRCFTPASSSV